MDMRPVSTIACGLLVSCLLAGCSLSGSEDEAEVVEIHLTERFQGEVVRVELDGRTLFAGPVHSSRAGLAGIIPVHASRGSHRLRVQLDDARETEMQFLVTDPLFVRISYDLAADGEMKFMLSTTRPTYW